jgi:DNA mismatch repair protein MutL
LRQLIVGIFSGKTNEKLVPISEETELVRIQGFVSKPEFAKKNRGEQFFFVNNRFIKSGYLHHSILSAYEGLLKDGMQPAYFIYLDVPPNTIDINIHPTKTEIKFDDEHALYAILRSSIKHSLGQFNVSPVLDFDRDPNLDTPYQYNGKDVPFPTIQVDSKFNPFVDDKPSKTFHNSLFNNHKSEASNWESLYVGLKSHTQEIETIEFEPDTITSSLFNDQEIQEANSSTYQIHRKYIVTPIKSGMMIIDQNRAHQRILYEQYLTNMTVHQAASQQLLFPLELYFSANERALLFELQDSLHSMGFVFDTIQNETVVVSGIPVTSTESQVSIVLEELLRDLQDGIPENSYSQNDSLAKSMARSLAVRSGVYLNQKEQENIVNGLFACKEPDVSPFQKPTFITINVEDIDKKFAI